MKRIWTIIGVRDVPSSFKWYQSLFGQPEIPPGHDYWGQILDTDGTVLLCLHQPADRLGGVSGWPKSDWYHLKLAGTSRTPTIVHRRFIAARPPLLTRSAAP